MTDASEGKGPGFWMLNGGVALLFIAMELAAALLGYVRPLTAGLVIAAIIGVVAYRLSTAQWASKP